jgi:2-dehydro-3-deoxyphosphogluconate aldolase / (4S)-4-hydroxy-2-oxoglutarate aldolase
MSEYFTDAFGDLPVLAILRGLRPASAVAAAEECWGRGIPLVEVSLSDADALPSLEAVCRRAGELGRSAGAGTVLTAEQVVAAAEAGAKFAVAPGLEPDAVAAAQARGLPYLPGVATPSEVQHALALGCRTVKFFPASVLGRDWMRSLAAPFPEARFVAVGGVDARNAPDWLAAGAVGIGVGSALEEGALTDLIMAVTRWRRSSLDGERLRVAHSD